MTVEIRKACAADLSAVRELLIETWHATYDAIHGAEEVTEITNRWHAIEILALHLERTGAAFCRQNGTVKSSPLLWRYEWIRAQWCCPDSTCGRAWDLVA
jgi:hypothetical protein